MFRKFRPKNARTSFVAVADAISAVRAIMLRTLAAAVDTCLMPVLDAVRACGKKTL
jgi:hypothetical protein